MAHVNAEAGQQEAAIQFAAQKYGVPEGILKGVYAIETASGTNVATSSAGAEGAFQFIPSTAKTYNYPLTNNVDNVTFGQQADSAAHYLSDLYNQHGHNWDAALHAYSGGGYGLAQVQAKAGSKIPNTVFGGPLVSGAKTAANTVTDVGSAAVKVVTALSDPKTWLRVAMGIGALVLLIFGLFELAGGNGDKIARHVPIPV